MSKRAIDTLAEFLVQSGRHQIPDRIFERAADCALDAFGAALAGREAQSVTAMQSVMSGQMQGGVARVWFDQQTGNPIAVATINAMAATALDVDDGHRMAAGHPGAAVIAAAAATAEATGASLEDFLTAVVLGYEAAVRVALARHLEHHTSTVSGRWSGVGAAVAAAKLQGFSAGEMAQCILIAEQQAPRLSSSMHHGFAGSDVKEGIAWSVHSGLFAVELAKAGFRGYPDTFEQNILYDPARLIADLGDFTAIDGLFFKPYACCRWAHAAIDALRAIMAEQALLPELIDRIEVQTFARAVGLGNAVAPKSEAEAQFSIPFCLATIAIAGEAALTPFNPALLENEDIVALARKVEVRFSQPMQDMFPAKAPATVRVEHTGRATEKTVNAAFGDPSNPMSRSDLQVKFTQLAKAKLGPERIADIFACFSDLEQAAARPARSALGLLTRL